MRYIRKSEDAIAINSELRDIQNYLLSEEKAGSECLNYLKACLDSNRWGQNRPSARLVSDMRSIWWWMKEAFFWILTSRTFTVNNTILI
jgi:hypothetical protein